MLYPNADWLWKVCVFIGMTQLSKPIRLRLVLFCFGYKQIEFDEASIENI